MKPLTQVQYSIASLAFLGLMTLNAFAWRSPSLGGLLLIFFLFFYGRRLHEHLTVGVAALLSLVSLLGALLYYVFELSPPASVGVVVVLVLGFVFFKKPVLKSTAPLDEKRRKMNVFVYLIAGLFMAAALSLLLDTQIIEPVRSPWLVIPPVFFLVVFLYALLAGTARSHVLFVALFGLTVSIALIVYPLGYGFDSFVHQATEEYIVEHGTITPKPLYYVGQYTLVVIAAQVFSIPVDVSDAYLLPLLATLILVPTGLTVMRQRRYGVLALFLIPLSSFIVTTPQGLANFWILLLILTSLLPIPNFRLQILFTLAALVTHPLSGIPAALFLAATSLLHPARTSRTRHFVFIAVGATMIPLLFVANSLVSGQPIALHSENLFPLPLFELLDLNFFFENRFHAWKDLVYLVIWNQTLLVLILALMGYRLARRLGENQQMRVFALLSILMVVNYIVLDRLFEFAFLIEYERSNYAERLFQLAQFFAMPLVALAVDHGAARLVNKPLAVRAGALAITALVLTSVVYATYPRQDNYEISRGFNVGTSDFATVTYIHEKEEPGTYVVLANQAVSAAALKTYGFETYFNGDIFYYPIPTGGALYELYLDMVNLGPTHERAVLAMELASVDTAYFVVNDYWYGSSKIIENAKREAQNWVAIDNGATYVFEFQR